MAEEKFEAVVGAGIEEFKRKMREVNEIMRNLATGVTVDININTAHVMSEIAQVERKLDRLDGRNIDVRVDLNSANLNAVNLNGRSINVDVDSAEVIRKLEQVQQRMREIARERINVIVDLDLVQFLAQQRILEAHIAQLKLTRIEIDVTADLTQFRLQSALLQAQINALNQQQIRIRVSQIGGLGGAGGGGSLMGSALLTLLPAVIPLAAAATNAIVALGVSIGVVAGQTVALASALGVAFAGYAAFGALAIPTIIKLFDEEAKLTDQQKRAKNSVEDLTATYKDLVKATEKQVLNTFISAMNSAEKVLKKLEPLFVTASKEAEELMKSLNQSLDSAGMQKFFTFLNEDGAKIMGEITRGLGYFINGTLSLLTAFRPLANSVSNGFLDMSKSFSSWADSLHASDKFVDFMGYIETQMPKISSIVGNAILGIVNTFAAFSGNTSFMLSSLQDMMQQFREWSSTLSENQGFQKFLDYAQQSGGQVVSLIGEIVKLIINFSVALAPVGSVILAVITAISGFINRLMDSSDVLAFLIAIIPSVAAAVLALATPVMLLIKLFSWSAIVSTFGAVIGFLASPIGIVISAITLLTAGIAIAYESFEPFRELLNSIGSFLSSTFNSAIQTTGQYLSMFGQAIQDAFNGDFSGIVNFFTAVIPNLISNIISKIPMLLQIGGQILSNLLNGFVQNLPLIVSTITTFMQSFVTTITTHLPRFLQTGVEIFSNILDGIIQALPQIIAVAVQVITTLISAWAENYPKILKAGLELLLSLVDGILQALPDLIQAALEILLTLVETILSNLPKILEAGVEILLSLVDGIVSMLPDLIDAAIEIITTLVDMIAKNLPLIIDIGVQTLLALIEGILKVLPELITAAIELVTALIGAIAESLPKIIESGDEIVIALVTGLIEALPDLAKAAVKLVSEIVKTLINTIPKLVSAGADLVAGIVKGVKSGASSLISAVGSLASQAVSWFKKKLGIHSPSRVFEAVSKWIPAGIASGISSNVKLVTQALSGLSSSMLKQYNKEMKSFEDRSNLTIDEKIKVQNITSKNSRLNYDDQLKALESFAAEQVELNRMTAMEEAKYWKYAATAYSENTIQKVRMLIRYEDALKKAYAEQYALEQNYVTDMVKTGRWGYAQQIKAYEGYMATYKKGSDQQLQYEKLIYETKEQYYDDLTALSQQYLASEQNVIDALVSDIQALKDEYNSMYQSRVDSLTGFAGLFDSFVGNDVSELDIIGNMQQQVRALEDYQNLMNDLMSRGLSDNLIKELQEMGVASVNEIAKLAKMSDSELSYFQQLFDRKYSLANTIATSELSDERKAMMEEIQKLTRDAEIEITSLKETFAENLDEMLYGSTEKFKTIQGSMVSIGANVIQGLINGISSKRSSLSVELENIAKLMKSKLTTELDIHSPSRWAYDEVGLNYMYGIANALRDAQPLIDAQLNDVAATMKLNEANFTTSEQISANIRTSENLVLDDLEDEGRQPIVIHVHNDWTGEDILTYVDEESGRNYDIKLYSKGGSR
ncbi:hypothetical protein [Lysinibacillus sp. SGAir0095]|uniref:phage tail protein n=1 Tax=Lysinibacillus sp. SGAir0095 TaxID=2070463 RepID=UPI0010CD3136|nr:hypothetical protein [Lysinibacillus sp. SGAir0095]QCR33123.1 hypothetical protein C1N55_13445 [Lysinibacillus sp. SGAir0095]